MKKITLNAPAKINLMLDVTGRRSDGYHTINTVMQSVSLADTVELIVNNSGEISAECDVPSVPCGKENIACRAAEAFYEYAKVPFTGLHIKIVKRIPLQAGLGGGSADGAAVLVGLNKMYDEPCKVERLCNIGVKIGADVPFCIVGGTKICRGIGEIMSPAPPLEECFIVIGKGGKGISTKKAFEAIDALKNSVHNDITDKYDGTVASVKLIGRNIFEEVSDCSEVLSVKEILLQQGAEYAAMSGSGSAVFGLFRQKKIVEKTCKVLQLNSFFAEVCVPIRQGSSFECL
ncbi:MAG: 4-(cytidine 5'-diphospho)-2-C-methyl-D-erythritol kinase [Oscillospiraceae bacterium]|nr:4-(cytidine 5'-diphospho)-2-C-methyl-D-erythritol kinase [Oscillospiraceae bacterium]